jgi:hypothetical protein
MFYRIQSKQADTIELTPIHHQAGVPGQPGQGDSQTALW